MNPATDMETSAPGPGSRFLVSEWYEDPLNPDNDEWVAAEHIAAETESEAMETYRRNRDVNQNHTLKLSRA